MSGPIVRTGSNEQFSQGWDRIFGGKKSTAASAPKAAAKKKAKAAKTAKKKVAKKKAGK